MSRLAKNLILVAVVAAILAAAWGAVTLAQWYADKPETVITHADYDFSLSNDDIARTVLTHAKNSLDGDARAPENTVLSEAVISGPAPVYEFDNAASSLTCTRARYYYRFVSGEVGRVEIRISDGRIVSAGSGIHERYRGMDEKQHILLMNDFYGEYFADTDGVRRVKDAAVDRADYPDETFVSDFTAKQLVRRHARELAGYAEKTIAWETMTFDALYESSALTIVPPAGDYSFDNPAVAKAILNELADRKKDFPPETLISGPHLRWVADDEEIGKIESEDQYHYTMYYCIMPENETPYALCLSPSQGSRKELRAVSVLFFHSQDPEYLPPDERFCGFGNVFYDMYIITEDGAEPMPDFYPAWPGELPPYNIGIAAGLYADELLAASPIPSMVTLAELEELAK